MFDQYDENLNSKAINKTNPIENEQKNKNRCFPIEIKKPQINFSLKSTFNKFVRGPDYVTLDDNQIHENEKNDLINLVTGAKKDENKTLKAFTDYSTSKDSKEKTIQLKVDISFCNMDSDIKENVFILKILKMKIAQVIVNKDTVLPCLIKVHSNFFDGYNGWNFKLFCDTYKLEYLEKIELLETILTNVHPFVFYEKNEFVEDQFAPIIINNDLNQKFGIKLIDLVYKFNINQNFIQIIQDNKPKTNINFTESEKEFLKKNRNYNF